MKQKYLLLQCPKLQLMPEVVQIILANICIKDVQSTHQILQGSATTDMRIISSIYISISQFIFEHKTEIILL